MISFRQRISEVLVSQHVATQQQLEQVEAETTSSGKDFARVLIDEGIVSEGKLTELLSQALGLPMITLSKYRIEPAIARLIPERVSRRYSLIALNKFENRLVVAMSDPLNIFAVDDLKAITRMAIDPVLCPESEIHRAIEQLYSGHITFSAETAESQGKSGDDSLNTAVALLLNEQEDDAPAVRVINLLVTDAMNRRASDIHLEPIKNRLRVRYRVDGRLIESQRLPKEVQSPVLTRLKIMSGIDITESRIPQDGRFKVRLDEREVDFRVSILPITYGGKAVLRLLDKSNLSIGLDHLGFMPQSIELFKQVVKRPYGMILVTGPTGSGKSTTLYSVLNALNESTRNIVTIEDPVEYQVDGITQMQTNSDIGLTFASGLRAILRQSPDVIMIGEIRDFETADIAMKSSLTGHLVLSTLHTNDAPSAMTRLIDMGVEPFLVASSVTLVEAQRLVRKLCMKCREPFSPSATLLNELGFKPSSDATFFKAKGCRHCGQSGYHGRMGIVEVFQVDDHIRELIVSRAQSWQIKEYAMGHLGMRPLRQDGLEKVGLGLTTLEEVMAVTTEE